MFIPVTCVPVLKAIAHQHNAKMSRGGRENPQSIFQMTAMHDGRVRITNSAMFHLHFYPHPSYMYTTLSYMVMDFLWMKPDKFPLEPKSQKFISVTNI